MRVRVRVLACIAASFWPLVTVAGQTPAAASAPANHPCTSVIAYRVPGSTQDATSRAMVVVPHEYLRDAGEGVSAKRYPVVYLLHGYAVTYTRYDEKFREAGRRLVDLADRFGAILVMPDGNRSSWYLDAFPDLPDAADWQYERIIIEHAIPAVDGRYRTWAERAGRGITGMSMGGHGALYLAARHPGLFAAATSMSGLMILRNTTNPQDLAKRLGRLEEHRLRWIEHSVLQQADKFVGRDVALLLDCGWDDPFVWDHRMLHDKLMRLGVAHDYIERPGKHEWPYWINALPYHLQFITDRLKPAGFTAGRAAGRGPAIRR
ncbi:MAG: hypothetical protein HY718_03110, partial [Planctomycetes bacterium]|nr:hypothetical protein [Planctomycetota bacterium]